jgi:poly(3-hydroxybutyrate) depolymerase
LRTEVCESPVRGGVRPRSTTSRLGLTGEQHLQGQSIDSGGASRTFHLCRPQGLTDTVPLVVMLHRGFGNGAQAERSYQSDAEADDGHFLVAYPDGLNRAWNARPVALAFINGIMLTFVAGVAGVRRG